jgi:hypothetical protein
LKEEAVSKTYTLGRSHRRVEFEYAGSVDTGATIHFKYSPSVHVRAAFFQAALRHFCGQTVRGGFKMNDPPPEGIGAWVRDNAHEKNGTTLVRSPRILHRGDYGTRAQDPT